MEAKLFNKAKEEIYKRNTLFNKTVLIFIMVSVVSFIFTGFLLSSFIVTYALDENVKQMSQTAKVIDEFTDMAMARIDLSTEKINAKTLGIQNFAIFNSNMTGSHIYIVEVSDDHKGRVVVSAPDIENDVIRKNLISIDNEYFFSQEQYQKVLDSNEMLIDHGDYFGLYKNSKISWVTIAQKLETIDSNGNNVLLGITVISRPMENINITRYTVIRYFLLSVCIALLLSVFIAAFFTKRITEPIEKIRLAAAKVSRGNFGDKIEYDAQDDMGDLVNSFNAMMRSLENQDKTKNDFIANVSHELRTPITTIGGFIDGMTDGTIPKEKHEYYLKIVKDEVRRINKLVNDQLQIARLQQGAFDYKPKTFDINEMIRLELIKNEKLIEEKQLEIEVEFENEKQNVHAEPESINRVIINLLNNAIKFTPDGGKIVIGTRKKKETVEIFVKDTGIGIGANEIERVFERYFKSDRSRGVDKAGTGLGLSICKDIINAHKHIIKAENNVGESGTKFTFWLDSV